MATDSGPGPRRAHRPTTEEIFGSAFPLLVQSGLIGQMNPPTTLQGGLLGVSAPPVAQRGLLGQQPDEFILPPESGNRLYTPRPGEEEPRRDPLAESFADRWGSAVREGYAGGGLLGFFDRLIGGRSEEERAAMMERNNAAAARSEVVGGLDPNSGIVWDTGRQNYTDDQKREAVNRAAPGEAFKREMARLFPSPITPDKRYVALDGQLVDVFADGGPKVALPGRDKPSAPHVRDFTEGEQTVTRQYDPSTGQWREMSRGPRFSDRLGMSDVIAPILQKVAQGQPITPAERQAIDTYQRMSPLDQIMRGAMGGGLPGASPQQAPQTPDAAPPMPPMADTPPAPPAPVQARQPGRSAAPKRPVTVPAGAMYSPSRRQWRDATGRLYDETGKPLAQ